MYINYYIFASNLIIMDKTNDHFIVDFPPEVIEKIRQALPHGAMKAIGEAVNCDLSFVSQILSGKRTITKDNVKIILEAQRLLRDAEMNTKKIADETSPTP